MIRVTPPLPVIAGAKAGFLVEISATHGRVEWVDQSAGTDVGELVISHGSGKQTRIAVTSTGSDLYRFAEKDQAAAADVLHALRKSQHIELCASRDVEHSQKNNGFGAVELPVVALPEKSYGEISTATRFMGRAFNSPFLITGMTGGVAQGTMINERLALCASTHNIPMGVGSQRMALENPEHAGIFRLKNKFPGLFLIGNLGIGQLRQPDYLDLCRRAVDMIHADALAIHVNVLQELIQVEGDRDFRFLIEKIGKIQSSLPVPVLVKEVGVGLDVTSARRLWEHGIRHFDAGGSGGTSWAHIEGLRSSDEFVSRRGEIFRDWGVPTAKAVKDLRAALPEAEIVATGGIRDGLMALKAIHTGANMAGVGLPLMRAATVNDDGPTKLMASLIEELKIAMICSGLKI